MPHPLGDSGQKDKNNVGMLLGQNALESEGVLQDIDNEQHESLSNLLPRQCDLLGGVRSNIASRPEDPKINYY